MEFSEDIRESCLITGGHFILTEQGPYLNKGTADSFRKAVLHYKNNRHKQVGLGLLINNIGATCSSSSCAIHPVASAAGDFNLPEEYVQILREEGVAEDQLTLFFEKHMRNRGKKLLHKLLNEQNEKIVETDEGYIYRCPASRVSVILTRKSPQDKYGTPACPLIMCAFYLEMKKLGYPSSLNFYYVGEDNELNVPNHFVIEKGKFLAHQISPDLDTKNVYLFGSSFLKNWGL